MSEPIDLSGVIGDSISPDSLKKIFAYLECLQRWKRITNLTADEPPQVVWGRHVLDSVYLQRMMPTKFRWLDIGSGSGFPGVILGILLDQNPETQIHCVESDGRKCAFLRAVVQSLRIPVKIHNLRAECLSIETTGAVEVITARAVSSIANVIRLARNYIESGAVLLLPRGRTFVDELENLDLRRYRCATHQSPLSGGGVYLRIQSGAGNTND